MTKIKPVQDAAGLNDPDAAFVGLGDISDPAAAADFAALLRVRDAISAGRIELYVQPIVALPDRTTRFYEAFSRLRDDDGAVLSPASYLEAAERAHRIGVIDNLILTRCIDAIRRRGRVDPDLTVFCNLSPATLFDPEFFGQFTAYLEVHADLAQRIIFEFTLPSIHMMHPRVERNLAEIAERGFAFSVDHVHSAGIDWESLRARNFRYAKTSARMLFGGRRRDETRDRHASLLELKSRLSDVGIELIAEKIEFESDLAGIVSVGIGFAQGHLFGAAREADFYLPSLAAVRD